MAATIVVTNLQALAPHGSVGPVDDRAFLGIVNRSSVCLVNGLVCDVDNFIPCWSLHKRVVKHPTPVLPALTRAVNSKLLPSLLDRHLGVLNFDFNHSEGIRMSTAKKIAFGEICLRCPCSERLYPPS